MNIPSTEQIDEFVRALPNHSPLRRGDLLRDDLRLYGDAILSVYYAPFDHINQNARIVLIGITPGWQQMELAYRTVRDLVAKGVNVGAALSAAKATASFAGPTRKNLVAMLDSLGLPNFLGIRSTSELFDQHWNLVHTTSAIRYPTFVADGQSSNYAGHRPKIGKHPFLRRFLLETLAPEIRSIPKALIVPLGKGVEESLNFLILNKAVDAERCLLGLPHPSGSYPQRASKYCERQSELSERVRAFFASRS